QSVIPMLHSHQTATLFPYTTLFRSYEFSKKALKEWKQESVWEMRRRLADYGDGEFFLVSDTDLTEAVAQGTLEGRCAGYARALGDRKSTRLNSSHVSSSYAVVCSKK